jgi:S-adenosylmethionine/arginine decarboxylase-like enzyme
MLFHQHLLIKAYIKNPPTSAPHLESWLTRLVSAIKMKVVIPARAKYVDSVGNKGLTGQIGLETSHAAIHVWDDVTPGLIQMDVYSCKEFDNDVVIKMIEEFEIVSYELMCIDRNNNFKISTLKKYPSP